MVGYFFLFSFYLYDSNESLYIVCVPTKYNVETDEN